MDDDSGTGTTSNYLATHLMNISNQLGGIIAKLDSVIERLNDHVVEDKAVELRVTAIENNQSKLKWMLAGGTVVCTVIFGAIYKFLEIYFKAT